MFQIRERFLIQCKSKAEDDGAIKNCLRKDSVCLLEKTPSQSNEMKVEVGLRLVVVH